MNACTLSLLARQDGMPTLPRPIAEKFEEVAAEAAIEDVTRAQLAMWAAGCFMLVTPRQRGKAAELMGMMVERAAATDELVPIDLDDSFHKGVA